MLTFDGFQLQKIGRYKKNIFLCIGKIFWVLVGLEVLRFLVFLGPHKAQSPFPVLHRQKVGRDFFIIYFLVYLLMTSITL